MMSDGVAVLISSQIVVSLAGRGVRFSQKSVGLGTDILLRFRTCLAASVMRQELIVNVYG